MGASPTTCRVHIAQLRGITKLSPLLVPLEACALRKRGLECPSVGIQPPNPAPLFGKYLTKPIRFTTSLPAQCYTAWKIKSIALPLFVMDYGIGHWSFVPRDCTQVPFPGFTMPLSSSLREGYSTNVPRLC